ncbi:MAG: hypothetical protein RLZZ450_6910 [Pseudomonadota bacterium]
MTARIDNFEGLHVLLVTEDEARAQAIAKSLRERKAHVGDVRAGAKDPVAMRGADLLVIDARRAPSTDARVAEVRSDVRARWASVASIDYTTLAAVDGTVDLRALEGIVSRLAGMDKALTERARKEATFETTLAPLGPTRTLRALALAGPTLHVALTDGELSAKVDLADELLVSAFAERKGEKWEAWQALARVLGMTDANVIVQHRSHPAAMNIMEPVDQALEGAAQERVRAPHLFVESAEELSGLRGERRDEVVAVAQSAAASAAVAPSAAPRAATASAAAGSRNVINIPATSSPSAKPGVQPAAAARRDAFSDTPTDAAAPGLLQRMARTPANDASDRSTTAKSDPELSFDRGIGDDADFEGEEEYDQGEVTVVADASQLDILRETLGRYDAEAAAKPPLTSTMPAPRGNAPTDDLELELGDALRAASEASDAMNNEAYFGSSPPARGSLPSDEVKAGTKPSAPSLTVAANSLPPPADSTPPTAQTAPVAAAAATSSPVPSARPAKTAAAAPTLRLDGGEGARNSKPAGQGLSPKQARTWIMVALVVMALAAVAVMLWSQQQNRESTKARAKQPASAPAGNSLKR